jgi:release factor glutamine methyltransferase
MKIKEVLKKTTDFLTKKDFDCPAFEAEILLSFVLNKDREFFYSHPDASFNFWNNLKLNRLLTRRLQGWPVAYLIGHQGFYGFDFLVNKNVLIPRPETELMVDEAIRAIINYKLPIINLIDIGTGSGCVAISLSKKLAELGVKGDFYALDVSKKALVVAKKNAKINKVDGCIKFLHSNLLNVIDFEKMNGSIFITANLPYLTIKQVTDSPTIKKEPKIALISGDDGLDHYRLLFSQIKDKLLNKKKSLMVFCEIDETQVVAFSKLVKEFFPLIKLEIKKDLGGFDRLAILAF